MAAFADFYDLPRNVASLLIHYYCTKEICREWERVRHFLLYIKIHLISMH